MQDQKIDFIYLGTIFAKQKKLVLLLILSITILGCVAAFIWPKSYKSELTFIVTEDNAINFSSGGLLSGLANLSVNGSNVTSDQTIVIIRSKSVQNNVIDQFNLNEVYGTDISEALRKKLDNQIIIEETREAGLGFNKIISISMSYSDADPNRAFELINYYYNEVEKKVENLNRQNIEDGFLLLENRLRQNEQDLNTAEDSLVSFQTRFGILGIEEQARAQIEAIAQLKTEIVKLEVEIGYLGEVLGDSNSRITDLSVQKSEFEKQYELLLNGPDAEEVSFDVFQAVTDMPELFLEYMRKYREVVVQEEIYKVLYPQYEQQKLNYQEITSGLKIIDPALLPTYKDKPKRAYIIIASFMFACLFTVITVLFQEWINNVKSKNPEEYERISSLIYALGTWK